MCVFDGCECANVCRFVKVWNEMNPSQAKRTENNKNPKQHALTCTSNDNDNDGNIFSLLHPQLQSPRLCMKNSANVHLGVNWLKLTVGQIEISKPTTRIGSSINRNSTETTSFRSFWSIFVLISYKVYHSRQSCVINVILSRLCNCF